MRKYRSFITGNDANALETVAEPVKAVVKSYNCRSVTGEHNIREHSVVTYSVDHEIQLQLRVGKYYIINLHEKETIFTINHKRSDRHDNTVSF